MARADITPATSVVDEKGLYLSDVNVADPEADAKAIVGRILAADTPEDIFGGPGQLLSSDDVIGKPFTLNDVEYRESDMEGGAGAYSLLHVTLWGQTSETLVTCGARNVMAAAFRAKQLGLLPRGPVTLVEGKVTRKGYTPLWLQDMDKAAADAKAAIIDAEDAPFELGTGRVVTGGQLGCDVPADRP